MIRPRVAKTIHEFHAQERKNLRNLNFDGSSRESAIKQFRWALEYASHEYARPRVPDKYNFGILAKQAALAATMQLIVDLWPKEYEPLIECISDLFEELDTQYKVGHRSAITGKEIEFRACFLAAVKLLTNRTKRKKESAVLLVARYIWCSTSTRHDLAAIAKDERKRRAERERVIQRVKSWEKQSTRRFKELRHLRNYLVEKAKEEHQSDSRRGALYLAREAAELSRETPVQRRRH